METLTAKTIIHIGHQDFNMHTEISNNKKQKRAMMRRNVSALKNEKSIEVRQPVSTITHTTRQVAEHFLAWRNRLKNSLIGHNNPPEDK